MSLLCMFFQSFDRSWERERERKIIGVICSTWKKKHHGKFLSDAILSYINNRKNNDKMQF